jgi:hypothetical protein
MPTVSELKAQCKARGRKGYSKLKKAALLKLCTPDQASKASKAPKVSKGGKALFDCVMGLYTFHFFASQAHHDYVRGRVTGPRKVHLVVPKQASSNAVTDAWTYRWPVYFGKPMHDMFNAKKLLPVLGYGAHRIEARSTRFAVLGEARSMEGKRFWVNHVWGVNLESGQTTDARKFLDSKGRLRRKAYASEVAVVARLVVDGTMRTLGISRGYKKDVLIRMPAVGLGAYLSQVSHSGDRAFARQTFFDAIRHVFDQLPDWVQERCWIEYALYGGLPSGVHVDTAGGHVKVVTHGPGNNLFYVPSSAQGKLLVLVNAWDSLSFIGNGGSQDNTVDGMMVAGTGPGAALRNDSFLHNPFFNPGLLAHSDRWIRV